MVRIRSLNFHKNRMLDEVPGQAPGPERQVPIADRLEAEPPQLEYQDVGAEKIVAPILKKSRDASIVLLRRQKSSDPGRTDQQAPARLEHAPAARQPGIHVLVNSRSIRTRRWHRNLPPEVQAVEVGSDHPDAPPNFLEFPPADLRLHGRVGHAGDFDLAPAGKVGSRARSASEVQQAHPVLQGASRR